MKKYYFLGFLLLILKLNSQIFVTQSGAGNKSGSSWANASTLQNAISNAGSNSQLWLKSGVYNITSSLVLENNISNLKLYGGFAGTETNLNQRNYTTNLTILDGQNTTQILMLRSYNTEVNGITFRNGFVTGTITGGTNPNSGGGAIFVFGNNSILKNCKFTDNVSTSERGAGAVYLRNGGGHLVENCDFEGNKNHSVEGNGGGAIHNWDDNVTIRDSRFINNSSVNSGGAIYTWTQKANIINCTFENNHSDVSGGAIHSRSELNLSNSVFKSNSCNQNGGAIYTWEILKVTNSLFHQNSALESGGGIYNNDELYVSNSTFVSNQGSAIIHRHLDSNVNSTYLTHIFNSIFYNNTAKSGSANLADVDHTSPNSNDQSTKDFRRNIFQANTVGSNNLVGTNPLFMNSLNNFNLQDISPGRNMGENALYNNVSQIPISNSKDLAGNPRLSGNSVDLGAYETEGNLALSDTASSNITFYPNPVKDFLHIQKIPSNTTYKIFTSGGQLLSKGTIINNSIDLRKIDKGIYILVIEDGINFYSKKIIRD